MIAAGIFYCCQGPQSSNGVLTGEMLDALKKKSQSQFVKKLVEDFKEINFNAFIAFLRTNRDKQFLKQALQLCEPVCFGNNKGYTETYLMSSFGLSADTANKIKIDLSSKLRNGVCIGYKVLNDYILKKEKERVQVIQEELREGEKVSKAREIDIR